ncbi:MAG: sulfite exporter TauE/SafE family protein [Thermomicrobiales bacterium]|nr:sulfite exporter TauE/SafE family protein [Thermomicrobiales bacterium]
MDPAYVFAFIMVAVGAAVSGMAAFGFSLVIVPPMLLVFEPATVTAVVIVLTLITRWLVLVDAWASIRWRTVAAMAPLGFIGSFAGARVLATFDDSSIKLMASGVVITSALLLLSGRSIPGAHAPVAGPIAGFASGFLNTATGMAGPPVALLMSARDVATQVFRGTLTAFFYLISITGFIALIAEDLVGRRELGFSLAMLPAALIGTWTGQRLTRAISPVAFRRAILILLIITGVIGAVAALRDLA